MIVRSALEWVISLMYGLSSRPKYRLLSQTCPPCLARQTTRSVAGHWQIRCTASALSTSIAGAILSQGPKVTLAVIWPSACANRSFIWPCADLARPKISPRCRCTDGHSFANVALQGGSSRSRRSLVGLQNFKFPARWQKCAICTRHSADGLNFST